MQLSHDSMINDIRRLIQAGASPDALPPELLHLYFQLKPKQVPTRNQDR